MALRRILGIGVSVWSLALPSSASSAAPAVRVPVAGFDLAGLRTLTVEAMTMELNDLLAVAGVRLDWRWTPPGTQTAPDELSVVFLDSTGRGGASGHPVLANTATGHSGLSPVVWVYCPSVVGALGLRTDTRRAFLAERGLGVALGRVVAHEVVHALAPEVPHGSGLMAPALRPDALRGPPLALDVRSAATLNAAARSWLRWGGPPTAPDRRAATDRGAAR